MSISEKLAYLFERYQKAFIRYDIEELRACYHLPCTLNTPEQITLLSTETDCQQEFEAIFSQLQAGNISKVIAKNASFEQVSPQLYLVCIDWDFIDENDETFADFSAIYHLLSNDSQLKIVNVTSHDLECSLTLSNPFSW